MDENRTGILILGIGNDILSDDAIGPKLVQELEKTIDHPDTTFLTAATGGLELLEIIKDYKRVIILDAIKTKNGIPGTIYYLTPAHFKETLHVSSFHDISFLTALELAGKLNIPIPEQIDIIAIEIVEDLIFSDQFSPALAEKYPSVLEEVKESVQELIISG